MSKLTLEAGLQAQLNGLDQELELCDENGRSLGRFLPNAVYQRLVHRLAIAQCPYTAEQLAEMRTQRGGRTLEAWKQATGNR